MKTRLPWFVQPTYENADAGTGAAAAGTGTKDAGTGAAATGGAAGAEGAITAPVAKWYEDKRYETMKDHPLWDTYGKGFQSEEAFLKAGLNAKQMIGMDKVPIPKAEADWENWYKAAGRPDTADGYKLEMPKPEELPPGLVYDTNLDKGFKEAALVAGLNNKQAEALQKFYVNFASETQAQANQMYQGDRATAETALKRELGAAYDGYAIAAKAAMQEYSDPKFIEFLEKNNLGNHPEMIRIFGKIGKVTLGEEKLQGLMNGGAMGAAPAELDAKIASFRKEHQAALYDKTSPDHARLTEQLTALFKQRYPDQKA